MTGRTDLPPAPRARFALPRKSTGVLAEAQRERALAFVRMLLEAPTAPYHEDRTLDVVRRFAAERPGLVAREDRRANLILTWPGRRTSSQVPRLAFSAHLDHPGFEYLGRRAGRPLAQLLGGVPTRFLSGARLRFFTSEGRAEATARVRSAESSAEDGVQVELDAVQGRLTRGSFGVFDLTDGHLRGSRLAARVCDDLMGAAAILLLLDECVRTRAERSVSGIFTRAEETGFIGCIALLESGLLARDTVVVGLECSPRRSTARVGQGPVIRVGDRLSVFDPAVTAELAEAANRVAARVPGFRWQRALMDGGSCESTAYQAYGHRAGGMCLALGNYHNCGPRGLIAPEFVDWNDFEGLAAILLECGRGFDISDSARNTRRRLMHRSTSESARLTASAQRMKRVATRRSPPKGIQR